ncbi:hypothetical protein WJ09_03160 [Burkholderia vietnamiensis]|nr:hypothetical protein WJ09_03160 [Burkholderia vietnamiensis]
MGHLRASRFKPPAVALGEIEIGSSDVDSGFRYRFEMRRTTQMREVGERAQDFGNLLEAFD